MNLPGAVEQCGVFLAEFIPDVPFVLRILAAGLSVGSRYRLCSKSSTVYMTLCPVLGPDFAFVLRSFEDKIDFGDIFEAFLLFWHLKSIHVRWECAVW